MDRVRSRVVVVGFKEMEESKQKLKARGIRHLVHVLNETLGCALQRCTYPRAPHRERKAWAVIILFPRLSLAAITDRMDSVATVMKFKELF